MQSDYKVRFLHEDLIAEATAACWRAAPSDRPHIFDVIKLLEVLVTSGIDNVFHIRGDRHKGKLEIEFFDRKKLWWERPAWVTFGKTVKLTVDYGIWAAAKLGDVLACFILAHEIGHILLHDNSAKAFSSEKSPEFAFISPEDSAEEQANCFAGHLLLPTKIVTKYAKYGDPEMLAVLCNVPDELAADRLAAVLNTKAVLGTGGLTDYCRDCGNLAEVTAGVCDDCVERAVGHSPT